MSNHVSMCCGKEATPKMGAGTGFICSECRQVCKIWETPAGRTWRELPDPTVNSVELWLNPPFIDRFWKFFSKKERRQGELLHGAMILNRAVRHLSASPRFSVDDLQTWVLLNDMADDLLDDYEQTALCNHCATCD